MITGGYSLPNRHVIHCLGPVYGVDTPPTSCSQIATGTPSNSPTTTACVVAFPAISTGVFGYPMEEAARVAVRTVLETAPSLESVRRVRFVLRDESAVRLHREALAAASG